MRPAACAVLLAGTMLAALPAAAQPGGSAAVLRVAEWHGSFTVTESGTVTGRVSSPELQTTVTATLAVSHTCSGTFELTSDDAGSGAWSGEAEIACSVSDRFDREQVTVGGTFRLGSETSGDGRETQYAYLTVNPERGTYTFEVASPYVEATVREHFDGHTSTRTESVQGFVIEMRNDLVEDHPLPGDVALSGSISEPTAYGWGAIPGEPSGAITRTITWTIAPGRREDDVRVAIEGPACACLDPEGESGPIRFTATASEGGGTFGPFAVSASGSAPREVVNEGGGTPRLELAATRETGAVTLTIAYQKGGRRYTSDPFPVSFCAVEEPALEGGQTDFSFDGAVPGRLEVRATARAWLNGQDASDRLAWTLEGLGNGTARVPEAETGAAVALAYEGLPEWNGALGEKTLTARIEEGGCDCARTAPYRVFFPPMARNHPHVGDAAGTLYRDAPNWFYYWNQTAAARDQDLGVLRYAGTLPASDRPGDLPQGRYVDAEDRLYVSDLAVTLPCRERVARGTRTPLGQQARGIDCYAELLRHEGHHRAESHAWWPRDSNNPLVILHSQILDLDLDYVPNSVEEEREGCSTVSQMSCAERPFEDVTDREIDAYYVGWAWPIGQADEEDWSCGGKQWQGGTCPE